MTSRSHLALGLIGLVGASCIVYSLAADAQQAPAAPQMAAPTQSPPAPNMARDARGPGRMSPGDRAAFMDARIAGLHAGLQLTPDQEKMWPPIETAMRDAAKTMREGREAMRNTPLPADPIQRLERLSDRTIARGEATKKLADAAMPLYNSLSDEQKHRLPMLLRGARMGMGMGMMMRQHFAMRDDQGGGWRERMGERMRQWRGEGSERGQGGDRDRW